MPDTLTLGVFRKSIEVARVPQIANLECLLLGADRNALLLALPINIIERVRDRTLLRLSRVSTTASRVEPVHRRSTGTAAALPALSARAEHGKQEVRAARVRVALTLGARGQVVEHGRVAEAARVRAAADGAAIVEVEVRAWDIMQPRSSVSLYAV